MAAKKTKLLLILAMLPLLACSLSRLSALNPLNRNASAPDATAEILVYTALEEDQLKRYLQVFGQTYPNIQVKLVRESTGVITERLLAEKDAPQADVVWGLAATSLLLAQSKGLLEPYAPAGIERIDPKFRDSSNPPAWVGIDVWMSAFCVNTAEIERLGLPSPQSWEDLLNPAYMGYIVMPNPKASGTGFMLVSGMLQLKGRDKGWEYLNQLNNNVAVYVNSGSKPCKMAGAGDFPIGVSFGYQGIIQKNKGEPILTVFPSEGSGWEMEANALIKKGSIKPAARTFLDWAISEAAMKEYAQSYAITAARTDQPPLTGYPDNPIAQLIDNNFAWAAANRQAILDEWLARFGTKTEPD